MTPLTRPTRRDPHAKPPSQPDHEPSEEEIEATIAAQLAALPPGFYSDPYWCHDTDVPRTPSPRASSSVG